MVGWGTGWARRTRIDCPPPAWRRVTVEYWEWLLLGGRSLASGDGSWKARGTVSGSWQIRKCLLVVVPVASDREAVQHDEEREERTTPVNHKRRRCRDLRAPLAAAASRASERQSAFLKVTFLMVHGGQQAHAGPKRKNKELQKYTNPK